MVVLLVENWTSGNGGSQSSFPAGNHCPERKLDSTHKQTHTSHRNKFEQNQIWSIWRNDKTIITLTIIIKKTAQDWIAQSIW